MCVFGDKGQQFLLGFIKKKAEENWATTWRGQRCADLETKASKFCWILFKKKAEENWATTWRGERCAYLEPKASNFGWVLLKKKLKKIGRQHGSVKDVRIWRQGPAIFAGFC